MGLTIAIAMVVPTGSASARTSGASAGESKWIYFDNFKYDLIDPVGYDIQGKPLAEGGCNWSQESTPTKADAAGALTEIREVAVQPATCLARVQEGTVPEQFVSLVLSPPAEDKTLTESAPLDDASVSKRAPKLSLADVESVWYDVLGIPLTDVHDYLSWHWNGSCVTGGTATRSLSWHNTTFWQLITKLPWVHGYTCGQAYTNEYVHFKNTRFCVSIDTDVYYSPNGITGNANGWVDGWFHSSTASGGCTFLMNFVWYHNFLRDVV